MQTERLEKDCTEREHSPDEALDHLSTDTTDTVLRGNQANKGNYRNCTRRTDSLV